MGKHGKKHTHIRCPRCGNASYHAKDKICAACGYGRSAKRND
jgi:large subunit ribosomal protein L37e